MLDRHNVGHRMVDQWGKPHERRIVAFLELMNLGIVAIATQSQQWDSMELAGGRQPSKGRKSVGGRTPLTFGW